MISTVFPPILPHIHFPACPGTVETAMPGISEYGVSTAFFARSTILPQPEPSIMPTVGALPARRVMSVSAASDILS